MVTTNPITAISSSFSWDKTSLTYTFDSPHYIDLGDGSTAAFASSSQESVIRTIFQSYQNMVNLRFGENGATTAGGADISISAFNYADANQLGHVVADGDYAVGGGFSETPVDLGFEASLQASSADFKYTIAHEIGHILGLAHPHENDLGSDILASVYDTSQYTVMSYEDYRSSSGYVGVQTAQIADIAALQAKYGANTSYNSGNTTYDLSSSQYVKFAGTIWDGGGIDIYDASRIGTNTVIDLREGYGNITEFNTSGSPDNGGYYSNKTFIWNALGANIEIAKGGRANDTIDGNDLSNILLGKNGNDRIHGWESNDTIYGNDGNDYLNGCQNNDLVRGGAGNDTVRGGANNDVVIGESGNDVLKGDTGNDVLDGGSGADKLYGGSGSDIFSFYHLSHSTDSLRDIVRDFDQTMDLLRVSGLGFDGIRAGSGSGSILGYYYENGATIVADADSTFSFEVSRELTLDASDFIF